MITDNTTGDIIYQWLGDASLFDIAQDFYAANYGCSTHFFVSGCKEEFELQHLLIDVDWSADFEALHAGNPDHFNGYDHTIYGDVEL